MIIEKNNSEYVDELETNNDDIYLVYYLYHILDENGDIV